MKTIGVVFGGVSSEYEVSLKSAAAIIEAMSDLDYKIQRIGITQSGNWFLYQGDLQGIISDTWWQEKENCQGLSIQFGGKGFLNEETKEYLEIDVLFPVLHGGFGENGAMQGMFDMMMIPYVGCGVTPSSVAMDKYMLHQLAESIGIQSTPTFLLNKNDSKSDQLENFVNNNGFPMFVKPNKAGSSKGITKVETFKELERAIQMASEYDRNILIQKEVKGVEIGCGILGNDELIVGECDQISLADGFFDYEEKYNLITAEIILPARIPERAAELIKKQAKHLYRTLDCSGLARIDFFLTHEGDILLNEVNTMPGFTAHSRFPMMMNEIGMNYGDVITHLIKLALEGKR